MDKVDLVVTAIDKVDLVVRSVDERLASSSHLWTRLTLSSKSQDLLLMAEDKIHLVL